jgi:hypothetical protein
LTLTSGSSIPSQSLGLQPGMVLSAGTGGTGSGTVAFAPLAPKAAVNGPNAPVTINYNPPSYSAPTDYTPNFTLTLGSILQQHMLVFAVSPDTVVGGANATTLAGLKGTPAGVSLVAGAGSSANFETATLGANQAILFSGYTLAGPQAGSYALPVACCGPTAGMARTTGTLLAAAVVPPVVVPPVVAPPVVAPPVVAPPVVAPPVVAPPVPPVVVVPPAVVPPVVVPPVVVVVPPIVPVVPPVPVVAVPVPIVITPPPVVIVPDVPVAAVGAASVIPQFAPFVVAPLLLQTPTPMLVVAPETVAPMQMVMVQAPAEAVAVPVAAPAPVAALPAMAPAAAPARPAKPFRN